MTQIYRVIGKGSTEPMFYNEFKERFGQDFDGWETNQNLLECLQGQPKLKNMTGPMYDGEYEGHQVIRYEAWGVYDFLSR